MTPQVWASALATIGQPLVLLYLAVGVVLGIMIGALPGLSATMGIALLTPITFWLPKAQGFAMMMGLWNAAIFAGGICAALFDRTRTGIGDKVTTNLYHVALWGSCHGIQSQQFGADYPCDRTKARNPFNNSFKSKDDKWFLICLPDYDRYFEKIMRMIGKEELIDDPDIQTLAHVSANHKEAYMAQQIGEGFATKDWEEWDRIMLEQEVPHQKLFRFTDIMKDEVCYDDDSLRRYESIDFGPRIINTTPLRFGQYGDPPIITSKPIGYYTARYRGCDIDKPRNLAKSVTVE